MSTSLLFFFNFKFSGLFSISMSAFIYIQLLLYYRELSDGVVILLSVHCNLSQSWAAKIVEERQSVKGLKPGQSKSQWAGRTSHINTESTKDRFGLIHATKVSWCILKSVRTGDGTALQSGSLWWDRKWVLSLMIRFIDISLCFITWG